MCDRPRLQVEVSIRSRFYCINPIIVQCGCESADHSPIFLWATERPATDGPVTGRRSVGRFRESCIHRKHEKQL